MQVLFSLFLKKSTFPEHFGVSHNNIIKIKHILPRDTYRRETAKAQHTGKNSAAWDEWGGHSADRSYAGNARRYAGAGIVCDFFASALRFAQKCRETAKAQHTGKNSAAGDEWGGHSADRSCAGIARRYAGAGSALRFAQ